MPLWANLFDAKNPEELQRAKRVTAFGCAKLEPASGPAATAKAAVTGSHDVFVEYGNVRTKFFHIATEGFA